VVKSSDIETAAPNGRLFFRAQSREKAKLISIHFVTFRDDFTELEPHLSVILTLSEAKGKNPATGALPVAQLDSSLRSE